MKTALNLSSEKNISNSLLKEFKEMTKMGLAFSVVFSTIAGYLIAVPDLSSINFITLIALAVGGYCMVGASNVYNQIIEKELDAKMKRTMNRPIASGRVKPSSAFVLATVLTILGIGILYAINPKTAMFGAISIFLYTSIYTPLKTVTPLSVFVGAFPGAIPFMLGWVAATDNFGIEAGTLFMIQFFWQFPHFWAIGWFLYDDYKKGGFSMLPTGKRDTKTSVQIILYTIWLMIASVFPAFGMTGRLYLTPVSAVLVFIAGLWMLSAGVKLYKKRTDKAARSLMLVSVTYISLIQIIYVLDKFLR
ncbi:heme o synthase [Myroides phaeus]|uniref:Protoheme IX farnesyltransferase n=1 Tax=Myroides phaeus TaxID=702745 RepID=A0A1G8BZ19_9FLAO|nr:heme o synthase [Myroides phaeus]MEC4115559.1 heme o synthase [Myroides phaeus]SDH38466.1 protoheme IX farnesyltransferase [Myroides phaeus]